MPLEKEIGDAATALSQNQYVDALDGTYWIDGWDATLGTGDLEVDIAPGEGAINTGGVETTATQTVDFAGDVDAEDPRKAVISVDDTGTVQKTLGDPMPADPEGEVRERTFDPAPPASVPGVVVAEVWLAEGATSLVSNDLRDRRLGNEGVETTRGQAGIWTDIETHVDNDANSIIDANFSNLDSLGFTTFRLTLWSDQPNGDAVEMILNGIETEDYDILYTSGDGLRRLQSETSVIIGESNRPVRSQFIIQADDITTSSVSDAISFSRSYAALSGFFEIPERGFVNDTPPIAEISVFSESNNTGIVKIEGANLD